METTLLGNRYQVLETLSDGGFGETFLVEDTHMPARPRRVLKRLKPVTDNPQAYEIVQERFQREAVILEKVGRTHAQIPELFAHFAEDGNFYLVQEWVEGQTLTEIVDAYGPLSKSRVRKILADLLPVLESIHSEGIIHRDIKPDNILIRKSDGKPCLIDFGAVKEIFALELDSRGNTTRSITIGTPGYMPSEQAAGRPVFSSDLYSLALTMVYLLTGKWPQELVNQRDGAVQWRPQAPSVGPEFANVLDKALEFHPRDRYSTAQDMLQALQSLQESAVPPTEVFTGPPPSTPQSSTPPVPPPAPPAQNISSQSSSPPPTQMDTGTPLPPVPPAAPAYPSSTRAPSAANSSSFPARGLVPVGIALLLAIVGTWGFARTCPAGESKAFGVLCQANGDSAESEDEAGTAQNLSNRQDLYTWEPARFTWGQQTLFPGDSDVRLKQGMEAFEAGNLQAAVESFESAVSGDRNNPEALIFYNNALAQQKGDPLTLAVVVPAEGEANSAEEMLRGVAQAQNEFNEGGGLDGRFLEIVIANDGNDPDTAAQVAEEIVQDDSVLGVIGHLSSSVSKAGLAVYEAARLPMIAPTSTSTELEGEVFFRTVPSDAAAAAELAQYASEQMGVSKAVIFYNPESSFSVSLQSAFVSRFEELGGESILKDMTQRLNPGAEANMAALQDQADAMLLFPNSNYRNVAVDLAKANSNLPPDMQLELLGGDSLYSIETLTAGGEAVEGLILAISWFADAPQFQAFSQASERWWGGQVSWRTAMSYDATQAFIQAFTEDATPASVLENLGQVELSADETSGQAFSFTPEGERQSEPVLVRVTRGSRSGDRAVGYELVSE
ncbi:ABC transporter substrate-binding protein [Romeria aff. gracilis LEGE 07310]|uniref:non-specific serine/threonine protein kinase n=1 Tax=Vasconcelosia minhoensis LEGE 07310 TaxID=915328 RepID=A0A8J7ABG3_9CYAN|nr:bifunctional serine/threonine-protein kinase/ABC transporter substrate-binding protein [Romeria gracilis]MBE9079885.1 ABC transporter substrate-binding protein [Romeria aff. gracilis LEGE 07310]